MGMLLLGTSLIFELRGSVMEIGRVDVYEGTVLNISEAKPSGCYAYTRKSYMRGLDSGNSLTAFNLPLR